MLIEEINKKLISFSLKKKLIIIRPLIYLLVRNTCEIRTLPTLTILYCRPLRFCESQYFRLTSNALFTIKYKFLQRSRSSVIFKVMLVLIQPLVETNARLG